MGDEFITIHGRVYYVNVSTPYELTACRIRRAAIAAVLSGVDGSDGAKFLISLIGGQCLSARREGNDELAELAGVA